MLRPEVGANRAVVGILNHGVGNPPIEAAKSMKYTLIPSIYEVSILEAPSISQQYG